MRIRRIEVLENHCRLAVEVGSSQRTWRERSGLLLRLWDQDGLVGQGEASPLPGYSVDSLEACRAELGLLEPLRWPGLEMPAAAAGSAGGQRGGGPFIEALRQMLRDVPVRAPAARFALETALLDLLGQRIGCPVSALLGVPGQVVPLSGLLHERDGDLAAGLCAAGREAVGRGLRAVKWKIGRRPFEQELAALRALRAAIGEGVALYLDVNRGWRAQEAPALLEALVPLRPAFVEEPVMAGERWPEGSPVPLAVDESLLLAETAADALLDRLLERGSVAVVVLKPMALGGVLRCLALAERAAAAGARVVVTHLFDGPVALAAAAELALGLRQVPLACGLAAHVGLAAWPAVAVPQVGAAELRGTGLPGLGLGLVDATRRHD